MPLGEYERQVLPFNLHVEVIPDEAPERTMSDVMAMLQRIYDDGEALMFIGEHLPEDDDEDDPEPVDGDNAIFIREMKIDRDGIATILLHHGDDYSAVHGPQQIRSGKICNAGKKDDEGVAHAAHLIIPHRETSISQWSITRIA